MGRYPKSTHKRIDLIGGTKLQCFGAFVNDGVITPGWSSTTNYADAVPNLVTMCLLPGAGILAGTDTGLAYSGTATGGLSLVQKFSDGGSMPFSLKTYDTAVRSVLFSGNMYTTMTEGGSIARAELPHALRCGAMRRGRLFAADALNGNMLRWSGPDGFNDWSEGISGAGHLILQPDGGDILDIFDFEDELVVFRQREIVRFSVFGDPENFKVKQTLSVPDVALRTARIAGDGILFFSLGGLMRYRGGRVERIGGLISDDLVSATSSFMYSGRYYFISGTSKSLQNSVVYVYDAVRGSFHILNIPAYFIAEDDTSVLAYASYTVFRVRFGVTGPTYEVATEQFDFGTDRRKLLLEFEVDCDDDVQVKIYNGTRTKTVIEPNGRTRLNMRGARFNVSFIGSTGSVRSAYLTAEVTE